MKTAREILDENDLTGKLKCYDANLCERDYQDRTANLDEYGDT